MRKTKRLSTCALSFFLALVLIFLCFPAGAVSLTDIAEETEAADAASTAEKLTSDGTFEVVSLREKNVKHFRLPDGSFVAAQYDTAVHYKDENGAWQDIDNTLYWNVTEGTYETDNGVLYAFPAMSRAGGALLSMDDGEHRFSFSLEENISGVAATVENPVSAENVVKNYKTLSSLTKLSSRIRYTDIMSGVDIEYVLVGDRVYENIILKTPTADSAYTFRLSMEGLTLSAHDGGALVLSDSESGEEVFTVPASFMTDASASAPLSATASSAASLQSVAANATASYSRDVSYTLAYDGDDILLTIAAGEDWISDASRTYPVTIDPPIYSGGSESSEDTYISSAAIYSVAGDSPTLWVGRFADGSNVTQEAKAFWKATSLPTLPAGAAITNAMLSLHQASISEEESVYGFALDPALITVSVLDGAFSEDTTSWSNAPAVSSTVLDYSFEPDADADGNVFWSWDISKALNGWMSGTLTNNGVCLSMAGTARNLVQFHSSEGYSVSPDVDVYVPTLTVFYRSALGLDALYTYSTVATPAGTAYLADAMGSVTLVSPTVASENALWNYTPSLVYRSQRAEHWFLAEFEDGDDVPLKTGAGFMADFEECVHHVYTEILPEGQSTPVIDLNYFTWIDSDGTEHRFNNESVNVWRSEEDETLTLTWTGENCKLQSTKSTGYTLFSAAGRLQSRVDESGNALRFHYDADGFVNTISLLPAGKSEADAITLFTVVYQDGLLSSVTSTASGLSFTLSYMAYGASTVISYMGWSDRGALINYGERALISSVTDMTSGDTRTVNFTYDGAGRVSEVSHCAYENGDTRIDGETFSISRQIGETVYRTAGSDDIHGNTDDLLTTYVYDTAYRTVRAYTTNLDKTAFYGGSASSYVDAEDEKAAGNIYTSSLPMNLLQNGGFETGTLDGWSASTSFGEEGAEIGTVSAAVNSSLDGFYGAYSLKLSSESSMLGAASAAESVWLDPGVYTFSGCFRSDTESSTGVCAYLAVKSPAGTVTKSDIWSHWDQGSDAWRAYRVCFTVETAGSYTIAAVLETAGGAGYVYADNLLLVHGEGSASMNYVRNGDLESNGHWTTTYTTSSTEHISGERSLSLTGSLTAERSTLQTVFAVPSSVYTAQRTIPHQNYLLSAWAKADSVPLHDDSTFALIARATYYDISTRQTAVVEYRTSYNAGAVGWQEAEISVALTKAQMAKDNLTDFTAGAKLENQLLIALTVGLEYNNNANTVYFDRVALVYDESHATSYEYDGEDLTTVTLPDGKTVEYTYTDTDAPHKPTSVTATDGSVYNFSYDEKGRITQSTCTTPNSGYVITTSYTYDGYGNVTATETGAVGTEELMQSGATYETDTGITFGALTAESDALGNVTRYFYDNTTGRLRAVINPDGTGTAYTYDALGRVTGVFPVLSANAEAETYTLGEGEVSYTYNADNSIAAITTESTSYSFTYDAFGNRIASYADGNLLASYVYADNNGKLISVDYGNGFSIRYTYDTLDRIVGVRYNNGSEVYSYSYNEEGNLTSHTDTLAGYRYLYSYDLRGRMTSAHADPLVTGRMAYSFSYTYDEDDRVTETRFTLGELCYSYKPTYDADGAVTSYSYAKVAIYGGTEDVFASVSYDYDAFGRLTTKDNTFADGYSYSEGYSYTTYTVNGKTYTSTQVKQYTRENAGYVNLGYRYDYDANGRITKVYWSSGGSYILQKEYAYDAKGQLVYEHSIDISDGMYYMGDAPVDNTVYTFAYRYTYDDAGNMTSKKKIAMTKDANGNYTESHTVEIRYYTYGAQLADGNILGDALLGEAVILNPAPGTEYTPTYSVITYDEIGNPLSYSNAKHDYTFTWTNGRQLASVTKNGVTTSYTYNKDGIRTSKTVNGVRHDYILNGSTILAELWTVGSVSYGLYFTYDEKGVPISMEYCADGESQTLYYVTDAYGKIVGLVDEDGIYHKRYIYDAYGNVSTKAGWGDSLDTSVADLNPFLYNGYYYDTETGFYYCNSRYYDPENNRFVNEDSQLNASLGLLGYNIFSYCLNNPINMADHGGEKPGELFDTIDAAARDFAEYINGTSIESNCEYNSYIYTKTVIETRAITYVNPNIIGNRPFSFLMNAIFRGRPFQTKLVKVKVTKYTYRTPKRGTADSSTPPINWFGRHNVVGLVHTHAAYKPGYRNDVFSYADKRVADKQRVPAYVATPLGTLRKYDPKTGADIVLYEDIPFDPNHPERQSK